MTLLCLQTGHTWVPGQDGIPRGRRSRGGWGRTPHSFPASIVAREPVETDRHRPRYLFLMSLVTSTTFMSPETCFLSGKWE